jgi:hypothetical protein
MNHSNNINELAAALAKAQGCMAPAKMDSVNPFLKNRYADLGSVIQAARQPLSANGLSFTQHPAVTESQVSVTTLLLHASGEWIESEITLPLDGGKGLSLAQSMGAIITYLRRYSLASILGIYADEDTDGNESKKAAPAQKATVPAPAPTSTQAQATATQVTPVTKDAPLTLQQAESELNSKNLAYGLIDTPTLAHMANALGKLAKLTTDQERKMLACQIILADRAAKAENQDDAAREAMNE